MINVTFDGVEYTKATHVAKQFGYTSDYLGQLCRAKKVNARLVGRSWFINVPSLEVHRKKKYQSKKTAEKPVAEEQDIEVKVTAGHVGGEVPITVTKSAQKSDTPSKKYLRRVPAPDAPARKVAEKELESGGVKHVSVHYEADEHSLIPKVSERKAISLKVGIAGAEALKIHSGNNKVSFLEPAPLPDVALSGSLSISEIPDGEYTNEEPKKEEVKPVEEESSTRDKLLNKLKMSLIDRDGNTHSEEPSEPETEPETEIETVKVDIKAGENKKKKESAKAEKKPESEGIKVKITKEPDMAEKPKNKPLKPLHSVKKASKTADKAIETKRTKLTVKVVEGMNQPAVPDSSGSVELPVQQATNQVQMIPIQVRLPLVGATLGLVIGSLLLSAEQVVFVVSGTTVFDIKFAWTNVANMALVLFTG
jgi:hypothetical protein